MASLTGSPSQEGSPRTLRMCMGFPHHVRGGLTVQASLPLQVTPGAPMVEGSPGIEGESRSLVICWWVSVSALSASDIAFVRSD